MLKVKEEEQPEETVTIHAELMCKEGIIYAWASLTGTFIAQGKTLEELEQNISNRFPGIPVVANSDNVEQVYNESMGYRKEY